MTLTHTSFYYFHVGFGISILDTAGLNPFLMSDITWTLTIWFRLSLYCTFAYLFNRGFAAKYLKNFLHQKLIQFDFSGNFSPKVSYSNTVKLGVSKVYGRHKIIAYLVVYYLTVAFRNKLKVVNQKMFTKRFIYYPAVYYHQVLECLFMKWKKFCIPKVEIT